MQVQHNENAIGKARPAAAKLLEPAPVLGPRRALTNITNQHIVAHHGKEKAAAQVPIAPISLKSNVAAAPPQLVHQSSVVLGGGVESSWAAPRSQQQDFKQDPLVDELSDDNIEDAMDCDDEGNPGWPRAGKGKSMPEVDCKNRHNPQYVVEYVNDIMDHLKNTQMTYKASHDYLSKHQNLTPRMREILIDWLVEVHDRFKLRRETLFLMVNVIDRYLSQQAISRTKLQLLGCAALLVAAKYEEIYPPQCRDLVHVTDNAYTKQELLLMESAILRTLSFNLTVPSADRFVDRFAKLANADDTMTLYMHYLCELTLPHYHMLRYTPSTIAAASTYLTLALNGRGWTETLSEHTSVPEAELVACARDMYRILRDMSANTEEKYRAVFTKYSSKKKYGGVATIPVKPIVL